MLRSRVRRIAVGLRHDAYSLYSVQARRYGTLSAMEHLMPASEVHSGLKRLWELGLVEWSIESAMVKFRGEFSREAIERAEGRLAQVQRIK